MDMMEILRRLSAEEGVSGEEKALLPVLRELLPGMPLRALPGGSMVLSMGPKQAKRHVMVDAHIDRIGLIVTWVDPQGFLKAEPVGGVDLRSLPGSAVRVRTAAGETLLGVVCTTPPHLAKEEASLSKDAIWIDAGLSPAEAHRRISPGDMAVVTGFFRPLLSGKAAVGGADNRGGCAVLVRCAQLLSEECPEDCRVSLVFSSQEETSESGAKTAAFALEPTEAVVVDAGFGSQDGVPKEKSAPVGGGLIFSIAPVLSRELTNQLITFAEKRKVGVFYEVSGRSTGTNADAIAVSRGGVPCGVVSFPVKNMHTQAEMLSVSDLESAAWVICDYIREGGVRHA